MGQNGAGKWAADHDRSDGRVMAIVALAVMFGVVVFDAHEFINRRTRRH